MLDSTLGAEALRTADCLRRLIFIHLLDLLEAVLVELATLLSQFAQRPHRVGGIDFQSRFEMVSLGTTAFEAVAKFEGAAVALAGVFAQRAVDVDAGRHGVCRLVMVLC